VVHFKYYFNRHAIKDGGSGEILSNKIGNQKMMILDDKRMMMVGAMPEFG
jgi:hypothetical protein